MRKKIIFISFLIYSLFLFGQELFKEDINLNNNQNQGFMISTVAETTPLDMPLVPSEYVVGSGDIFILQIISATTETYQLQVSMSDKLSIPGFGQVDLYGKTLEESIDLIEDLCKGVRRNSVVNVNLSNVKKLKVPIFGAVENPGMITLPASSRLNEYLNKMHLHHLAKDFSIEIRSDNDTMFVNIYNYYLNGDLESNPYLRSGQSVYIPFADAADECVEVYGPVNTKSLVPLIKGESLLDFYHRKIRFSDISDYTGVTITRSDNKSFYRDIPVSELKDYILKAGDILEFAQVEKIQVNGYVNKPGTYDYIPGHTTFDYIAMAGGASKQGNANKVIVIRGDKKIRNMKNNEIQRGDIILVKRSIEDVMIGQISLLSFIASIASITTAFIAAYNSIN